MGEKLSNNILPDVRGIIDGGDGRNYGFDDCMALLMERLAEKPEINYHTFAAITGDGLTQVYNKNKTTSCEYCVSGYLAGPEYISYVFDAIGYEHTYVTADVLNADKELYIQKLMSYIDRGLPVIVVTNLNTPPGFNTDVLTHFIYVGYEDYGKRLLFVRDSNATGYKLDTGDYIQQDWIFIGDKKKDIAFADIIRNAIIKAPYWMTLPENEGMFFGAEAYRAWADNIENGRYENETDLWCNYGVYVCNLATNMCCTPMIFNQFIEANPQYSEIANSILGIYSKISDCGSDLEKLGGGFNVTQEAMRDKEKRIKIADKIREAAIYMDEVVQILQIYS